MQDDDRLRKALAQERTNDVLERLDSRFTEVAGDVTTVVAYVEERKAERAEAERAAKVDAQIEEQLSQRAAWITPTMRSRVGAAAAVLFIAAATFVATQFDSRTGASDDDDDTAGGVYSDVPVLWIRT